MVAAAVNRYPLDTTSHAPRAAAATPRPMANGPHQDAVSATTRAISPMPPANCSTAGMALSPMNANTLVSTGMNASPSTALRSIHLACITCCLWANVSDSRAKLPCASLVCSMISARVAACLPSSVRLPPTFSKPIAAALASTLAALRVTPYRSMGSCSPLSADDRASTASLVVPPNMLDMSAPRPISSLVLGASSSMAMPPFLSWLPMRVPSSLYSLALRPTAVDDALAHSCMVPADCLNTVSMAPTDCSRLPDSCTDDHSSCPTCCTPAYAARPARAPLNDSANPPPARFPPASASCSARAVALRIPCPR